MKKKNIATIAIIILAIALVSGCIEEGKQQDLLQNNNQPAQPEPKKNNSLEKLQQAKEETNPELCKEISETVTRDNCLKVVAIKMAKSSVCAEISAQSLRNTCYYDVARNSGNFETCKEISEQGKKDNCFMVIGKERKNKAACEQISDQRKKEACLSQAS